ncbi:MAG: type I DNA topoisomerase [Fusobacteriota bacterium]
MAKNLVIVESPSKAGTIKKILGKDFQVTASNGHIKNLPKTKLGVDLENNFEPRYITIRGKGPIIKKLKKMAKKVDNVYLAADPDREGEAIAWHVAKALKLDTNKNLRVEFNAITKSAVKKAISEPHKINFDRVNSQQARRILDRLVGYKISPLLWQIISKNTSAGRVQSVALRLICDLEEKIQKFKPETYWEVLGKFDHNLDMELYKVNKKRVKRIKDKKIIDKLKEKTKGGEFEFIKVETKKRSQRPPKPLKTSTLQQLASSYLSFSSYKTMKVAQSLYEGVKIKGKKMGLITYMRTDSIRISDEAKQMAQNYIREVYGEKYVGDYKTKKSKKKTVQDAHEAIRPTDVVLSPKRAKEYLKKDEYKLYKLIWERFMVSQFSKMKYDQFTMVTEDGDYQFRKTLKKVTFQGYYKIFKDDENIRTEKFPDFQKGDKIPLKKLEITEGKTKPPARLTEAGLVKQLEEQGIGRPSTYSSIIGTLQHRDYVEKQKRRFKPTTLGFRVVNELKKYFPNIMDIEFTAKMEDRLDDIETGDKDWKTVLDEFYTDFESYLKEYEKEVKKITERDIVADVKCPKCGSDMLLKTGRFGKYLECEKYEDGCKKRLSLPKGIIIPKEEIENGEIFVKDVVKKMQKEKNGVPTDLSCTECDGKMLLKRGRYGKYLECENYGDDCKERKSLEKGVTTKEVDGVIQIKDQYNKSKELDDKAIAEVGPCDKCGSPLIVKMGRYGKFLACSNYPDCKNIKKYPKKYKTGKKKGNKK